MKSKEWALERVRLARYYWMVGNKYMGMANITIQAMNLTGIWLLGTQFSKYIGYIIPIMIVAFFITIITLGYLERNVLGFVEKDQDMHAKKNPMWKKQMNFNREIVEKLDDIEEQLKNNK